MAINFIVQSRKDYAAITVRYTDTYSDAKARTPIYIEKSRLVKSKVIKYKTNRTLSANERTEIKEKNLSLEKVEIAMKKIERLIYDAINEKPEYTKITSRWLKQVVNQTNKKVLENHIQNWVDNKASLTENTKKSASVFQTFMAKHFDVSISLAEIDIKYFDAFKMDLQAKNYAPRTINQHLSYLLSVCDYAEDRGFKLNFNRNKIKRLKQRKAINSYLTNDDIKKLQNLKIKATSRVSKKDLEVSRDWLVFSCYTAMRSVDMYNLTNGNIKEDYIVFKQQKTDSNDVYVNITTPVKAILERYKGIPTKDKSLDFKSWGQRYGRHIKTICEMAEINEMVDAEKKNGIIKTEKYKTINPHIGRMSFATNFYGKLPTIRIMEMTGHSSEAQLLTYINKNRVKEDFNLTDMMNKIIE